mmetsp:Transcript_54432/g.153290  ORF Transcript_54432/g.153290 Transcript_54432/m.153290 type:complete len:305 (+) Transcript_54432:75-989(+)
MQPEWLSALRKSVFGRATWNGDARRVLVLATSAHRGHAAGRLGRGRSGACPPGTTRSLLLGLEVLSHRLRGKEGCRLGVGGAAEEVPVVLVILAEALNGWNEKLCHRASPQLYSHRFLPPDMRWLCGFVGPPGPVPFLEALQHLLKSDGVARLPEVHERQALAAASARPRPGLLPRLLRGRPPQEDVVEVAEAASCQPLAKVPGTEWYALEDDGRRTLGELPGQSRWRRTRVAAGGCRGCDRARGRRRPSFRLAWRRWQCGGDSQLDGCLAARRGGARGCRRGVPLLLQHVPVRGQGDRQRGCC